MIPKGWYIYYDGDTDRPLRDVHYWRQDDLVWHHLPIEPFSTWEAAETLYALYEYERDRYLTVNQDELAALLASRAARRALNPSRV